MKKTIRISLFLLCAVAFCACLSSCIRIRVNLKQGVISNDKTKYYNESLGLGIDFKNSSSGFSIQSVDYIKNIINKLDFEESLEKAEATYDFFAMNNSNGASIVVVFENMYKTAGIPLSEKQYLEKAKDNVIEGLGYADVEVKSLIIREFEAGGMKFDGYYAVLENSGHKAYEYMLLKRVGNYMACITLTAGTVSYLDSMLSYIYKL